MSKKIKLSVVLATFNEEKNLDRCLKAVKDWAGEIIVVDSSPNDKTVKIARKYTDQVIKTSYQAMFHLNKQMAIDKAKGDWILQLDADEVVSEELKNEILKIINNETIEQSSHKIVAYYLPRKNYFLGRWLKKGGQYPDYVIRFFKQGQAHLPCHSVHEQMKVKGKAGHLNGHLLHYPFPNFSEYFNKLNRYTTLRSQELSQDQVSLNQFNTLKFLVFIPLKKFFSIFILFKGFQDGFRGFIFALFSGLQEAIAYLKYWEKNHEDALE